MGELQGELQGALHVFLISLKLPVPSVFLDTKAYFFSE